MFEIFFSILQYLIIGGIIAGISYFPLKLFFKYRIQVKKAGGEIIKKQKEKEMEAWIHTAVKNPGIAIERLQKDIEQTKARKESTAFLEIQLQTLKFVKQLPPQLIEMGAEPMAKTAAKLINKVPKLLDGWI
jgi:hypothetical protein